MHLDEKNVPQLLNTKYLVQTPTLPILQRSGHPTMEPAPTMSNSSKAVGY